tara:strand:+ start:5683 stop:5931 length:249 start_codon:yes stop_codon:yes gene_type:complete
MNRPYVKQYDAAGDLINPIIGEFVNLQPNRRERKKNAKKERAFSNKRGTQLVVTKIGWLSFMKYRKVFQTIGNKIITHFKLS